MIKDCAVAVCQCEEQWHVVVVVAALKVRCCPHCMPHWALLWLPLCAPVRGLVTCVVAASMLQVCRVIKIKISS